MGISQHVLEVPKKSIYLVIAGGQGYFVNPNTRKIVARTEWDDIQGILYNEASGKFVVTDGLRLAVLNEEGVVWSGERISIDGINLIEQDGVVVKGVLNDLSTNGCNFTFNIEKKELEAAWVFSENWG